MPLAHLLIACRHKSPSRCNIFFCLELINRLPTIGIMPGHYFFEGLIVSQYHDDQTNITASPGTVFYDYLECDADPCIGTAGDWVQANFPDWSYDNVPYNMLYLVLLIILTRVVTFWALAKLNYRST
jgi:hypothetical protein